MRSRRATPRRRTAPRWTTAEWVEGNLFLEARSGGRCECCGKPRTGISERHHRIRRRDGGDRLSNLLILDSVCHSHWTHHPNMARDRGLIVSAWGDPLDVPVLHLGSSWVLLDDGGEILPAPTPRLDNM